MEAKADIKPKFIAALIDISYHCEPDLLERCGGKLFMSGFYDDSVNTYICSAQPTVFFEALELVPEAYPEDEEASDALNQELLGLLSPEDSGYYGRSFIERMRENHPDRFVEIYDVDYDEDEDPADVVREALQGNPLF